MSYYQSPYPQQGQAPQYYYPSQQTAYPSPQPVYYTTSDSGHHHRRYNSVGAGAQYTPQSPYQRGRTYSTSYQGQASPAQYATIQGSHRRNQSTSAPTVIDLRRHRHGNQPSRSASRHHATSHSRHRATSHSRQYSDRQRRYSDGNLSFTDRLRRMFGIGPWAQHDNRSHHHRGHERYMDARTGREVDRRGRPIYRV